MITAYCPHCETERDIGVNYKDTFYIEGTCNYCKRTVTILIKSLKGKRWKNE